MLKICKEKWSKNNHILRDNLKNFSGIRDCEYVDLVRITVDSILNDDEDDRWDTDKITAVDDGNYQGTQMFLIPKDTYQPAEYEYLMTYAGYGSCSGCDTLQRIREMIYGEWDSETGMYVIADIPNKAISDLMTLCKHLLENIIKPYNSGWRNDEDYKFDGF